MFPLWLLVASLSVPMAAYCVLGPLRRLRRRVRNLCLDCAYDLTGNTSGQCPECGLGICQGGAGLGVFWSACGGFLIVLGLVSMVMGGTLQILRPVIEQSLVGALFVIGGASLLPKRAAAMGLIMAGGWISAIGAFKLGSLLLWAFDVGLLRENFANPLLPWVLYLLLGVLLILAGARRWPGYSVSGARKTAGSAYPSGV